MNTFLYLMDGISGVVTSNNNYHEVVEKVIGKKSNFLFENIYGYDCTAHSFASLVSGSNPSNYNVLHYRKSKYLEISSNIIQDFKKNNYHTSFISNNYSNNETMFLNHFDSYHLFKEKYPFPKINNLSNSNNLIFTHDLYTHDQNGQYSSGKFEYTEDEYLSLIKEHFEKILPQSLENIGYNPKHDNLILFSDHGMTIGDIKKEGKKNHWMSPSLDFKAKIFCFCFFANEEKKYIHKDACSIISINRLLRSKLLSNGINENNISDNDNYIVNTGNSSLVPQNQNKLNQFAYFRKGRKQNTEKYIFQINPLRAVKTEITNQNESQPIEIYDPLNNCPEEVTKIFYKLKTLNQVNILANLHAEYFNMAILRHYLYVLPVSKFKKIIKTFF